MGKTKAKWLHKVGTKKKGAVADADPGSTSDKAAAEGKALRQQTPRSSHAEWHPAIDRRDSIEMLIESSAGRVPHLLPIRYGRMVQSPFAFYRGAAAIMAADLAHTPATGLRVQACGDCHLLNFGVFATPERRLIFDVNDFDETLPAPWEWDIKRLATSFVIAAEHNRFKSAQARAAALACVRSYREQMARFSKMPAIDVWYERVDVEQLLARTSDKCFTERDRAEIRKAAQGTAEHEFPKLLEQDGQVTRIHDNPPLIYHPQHAEAVEFIAHLHGASSATARVCPTSDACSWIAIPWPTMRSRWWAWAAWEPAAAYCSCRPGRTIRFFCRSKKPDNRCSSRMQASRSTRTVASAWSSASG